ncbi:hypothetical protein E2C01_001771 [Portunus trituberculatus]|uniref:Uncharacterized protein n=1 Tax=Portunus trituberculatus TaxID=210409 RepID=A0A5B7CJ26_PORTR|nr:hypothetical protein [Portunus trituberculatus]
MEDIDEREREGRKEELNRKMGHWQIISEAERTRRRRRRRRRRQDGRKERKGEETGEWVVRGREDGEDGMREGEEKKKGKTPQPFTDKEKVGREEEEDIGNSCIGGRGGGRRRGRGGEVEGVVTGGRTEEKQERKLNEDGRVRFEQGAEEVAEGRTENSEERSQI